MIGRTAQRLGDTAAAIGDTIRPQDIPALRLDEAARRQFVGERWTSRWRGGRMLAPVVAAMSVFVLVTGVSVAGQVLRLVRGEQSRPAVGPVAVPFGTPGFVVTSVGGKGYVRSVTTGRLVARIPPPLPGFQVEGIAARPGDRVFYLAGETFAGGSSPHGRLMFYRVVLDPSGQPGRAQRVPGPVVTLAVPITSQGLITIPVAVSPDGNYLAYAISRQLLGDAASESATITVVRLATGASRTWNLWPAGSAQITELSWAQGGQLSWVGVIGDATVANGSVVSHPGDELSVMMVLGTAVAGGSLVVDSRLVTYGWASESSGWANPLAVRASLLDGPVTGVITANGGTVLTQILTRHGQRSKLVAMSSATGQITRVLLDGPRAAQANPASLDGDSLLFTLALAHEHPSARHICGHLALDQISTGTIVQLPIEIYCGTAWSGPPFTAAW